MDASYTPNRYLYVPRILQPLGRPTNDHRSTIDRPSCSMHHANISYDASIMHIVHAAGIEQETPLNADFSDGLFLDRHLSRLTPPICLTAAVGIRPLQVTR